MTDVQILGVVLMAGNALFMAGWLARLAADVWSGEKRP